MVSITDFGHWTASKSERWLHAHRNPGLELVYVANGEIDWDYEGRVVPVPPKHVSFTWPWETHGAVDARVPAAEVYWVVLPLARACERPQRDVHLHPALGVAPAEERRLIVALRSMSPPVIAASPLVRSAFKPLIGALSEATPANALRRRALILLMLSELAANAGSAPDHDANEAASRVRAFLSGLEHSYSKPWTLDSMAEACHLGRSRFALLVRELSGDSPIQHLNRVRIGQARDLLITTDRSITDIAFACGFSSSQYFSTVFRQFYECPPRAVRQTAGRVGGPADRAH